MKKFFTDYYEMVWLNSWKWIKRHWVGYGLLCLMAAVTPWVVFGVKVKLDERKEEEES